MATQNPLVMFGGDLQNVGGKFAKHLKDRGIDLPSALSYLAKPENDYLLQAFASKIMEHRANDKQSVVATTPPISEEVDLDADPRLPSGFNLTAKGTENKKLGKAVFEKRADGKLYVNGRQVIFHLSPNQQGGRYIEGHKLRKELAGGPNLNAAAKDFLLSHPEFIPDDAPNVIYFWDTIAADAGGFLVVSCLCRGGSGWHEDWRWLDGGWISNGPAARLAEPLA